jgi:hypothetical protein
LNCGERKHCNDRFGSENYLGYQIALRFVAAQRVGWRLAIVVIVIIVIISIATGAKRSRTH